MSRGALKAEEQRAYRIPEIDGLRGVAVLGVLYAHIWAFGLKTPPLYVGPFDINRALSVFGTGVDLFFVISGFCMYAAYGHKEGPFTWGQYGRFIAARAYRIYPAFAAAVGCAAIVSMWSNGIFPVFQVLTHLSFIHILVVDGNQLAAPFWSLATEWHFYIALPALIVVFRKTGFRAGLICSAVASIAYRGLEGLLDPSTDFQLPSRLFEFLVGIAIARRYFRGAPLPEALRGLKGIVLGFGVMLAGRTLMTEPVLASAAGRVAYAANVPILSLGYGMILWSAIGSRSLVSTFLGSPPMRLLGSISYSFYLWHWFPCLFFAAIAVKNVGPSPYLPILVTCISIIPISLIAWLSYQLFEVPYFRRRNGVQARNGADPKMPITTELVERV